MNNVVTQQPLEAGSVTQDSRNVPMLRTIQLMAALTTGLLIWAGIETRISSGPLHTMTLGVCIAGIPLLMFWLVALMNRSFFNYLLQDHIAKGSK